MMPMVQYQPINELINQCFTQHGRHSAMSTKESAGVPRTEPWCHMLMVLLTVAQLGLMEAGLPAILHSTLSMHMPIQECLLQVITRLVGLSPQGSSSSCAINACNEFAPNSLLSAKSCSGAHLRMSLAFGPCRTNAWPVQFTKDKSSNCSCDPLHAALTRKLGQEGTGTCRIRQHQVCVILHR